MKMPKNINSSEPLLTLGIITFNRCEYLIKMLDSIPRNSPELMNQLEIVIFNNGSTDNTNNMLQDYSKQLKFRYLEQKENIRGSETFEKIINQSTGKFMIIPGDDDIFYGESFPQLLSELRTLDPDVNLLTCYADVIDDKDRKLSVNYRPNSSETQEKVLARLIYDSIFWLPATVFRRKILANSSLSKSIIALDWSFWIEAITKGKYVVFPTPVIKYRQHPNREQESYLKQTWDLDSFLMLENSITLGSLKKWIDLSDTSSLNLFAKEINAQSKNKNLSDLQIAIYLLMCKELHKKIDIRNLIISLYENPNIKFDPRFIQTLFGINLTLAEMDIIFTSVGINFSYSGNDYKKHNEMEYFRLTEHNGKYSYEWKIGARLKEKEGISFFEAMSECLQVFNLVQWQTRKTEIESTITPVEKKILHFVRRIKKFKYGRRKVSIKLKWKQ